MRTQRVLFTFAVMCLASSCNHTPETTPLETEVRGFCTILEDQLKFAAEKHHQLAPAIDDKRFTDDQFERANSELASVSVGNTADVRRARVSDFTARLRFCQNVHTSERNGSTDVVQRLEQLREGLQGLDGLDSVTMSVKMPTAAKTAELLDQMYALAHEVNARPFKR